MKRDIASDPSRSWPLGYLLRIGLVALGAVLSGYGLSQLALGGTMGLGQAGLGAAVAAIAAPRGGRLQALAAASAMGTVLTIYLPTAGTVELRLALETDYPTWQGVGARHILLLLLYGASAGGLIMMGRTREEQRSEQATGGPEEEEEKA